MRAVYIEHLQDEDKYILTGDSFHHLVHVTRVSLGEKILLLNGKGLEIECTVIGQNKKELVLEKKSARAKELTHRIDVALGMPKKDALDLSLRQMVELGVHTAYLVRSQYSQMKLPDEERLQKLLISALEQSNSPHLTKLIPTSFKDIDYKSYDHVVVFDSQSLNQEKPNSGTGSYLLVVGPEGGFSPEEFEFFDSLPNLSRLHLPTPIMRTPTALSCGVGVVLQRLMD